MAIPKAKQYILDFEQMGLGMFVHWGIYSQLGKGEWVARHNKMPMDEYKKLADTFSAEDFNAEEMVLMAKKAGCKYINLTTRHHDGFSLYDTCGLSDFDAPHSLCKRDLVREFVDACNKHDIMPFFYHTTIDWSRDDYVNDFDAYLEYLRKSVEILCKNYGKVGGFWFDGNWAKPREMWKEDELYATIRKYQPEAIIVDNTGLDARGVIGHPELDSVTFEQGRPTPMNREGKPKYLAAEMCHTLNNHWGIGKDDFEYKSPTHLLETLCDCRKVGANYLLNIGPRAQGAADPYQKQIFDILGRWMNIFGESIYDGRPYPSYSNCKNFILKSVKEDCLYIFAYDLAIFGSVNVVVGGRYCGAVAFNNVKDQIESVKWMDNDEELDFIQNDNMLCVNLTGYHYGYSYGVRVAKAVLKK